MAFQLFIQWQRENIISCLCDALTRASNNPDPGGSKYDTELLNDFPEFALFKPDTNDGVFGAWWHNEPWRYDWESRINCLLFCIEMSKP
jgi:hypothetical protein